MLSAFFMEHQSNQVSCPSPAKWDTASTSPSILPLPRSTTYFQNVTAKGLFQVFIKTAKDYFSDHYGKKAAVIHVSEGKRASETSILQRGSCDSSDRLPELKCPSVDGLQGSDECHEQQADWVIDLGYESKFQVAFYRSDATTLTERCGHARAHE